MQNIDSVTASHRWSSTKSEAESEIHAEMDADADFGLIGGDFDAAYDATTNSTTNAEVLTLKIFIRSVNVEFEMPKFLNMNRCDGSAQNPMEMAEFLNNCGDRYVAGQGYGGYLIFVADASHLTEEERQNVSAELNVDYSIGNGNLAAYANTLATLEQENFNFRVVSRGFTQLLNLSGNPVDQVSPSSILTDLATLRESWVQAAIQGKFPDSDYGVVVDQKMNRYTNNSSLYTDCTGQSPGPEMACFEGLINETLGKIYSYENWLATVDHRLSNMGDYYWGATTTSANRNKDEYDQVFADLKICLDRISTLVDSCSQEARAEGAKQVCDVCNDGDVPYNCKPHHKNSGMCEDDIRERIECNYDNLESRVRSLSDEVMPITDLPNNGQMAVMTKLSQHTPGVMLADVDTSICALGGMSGEMASTSETVRLQQYNNNWYFNVSSSRTGITHTLRGQVWCALHSYFFDGGQSTFTTHPDAEAKKNDNNMPFWDASNAPVPDKYARALNGVSGNFAGGAEWGKINNQNKLEVGSNQGQLYAWGAAFGLDYPTGGVIEHGLSNEVSVSSNDKPEQKWAKEPLINVEDGLCYLHQIRGEFDGKDEATKIYQEDGRWMLAVSGLCTNLDGVDLFNNGPCINRKEISATASCYLYDQSQ